MKPSKHPAQELLLPIDRSLEQLQEALEYFGEGLMAVEQTEANKDLLLQVKGFIDQTARVINEKRLPWWLLTINDGVGYCIERGLNSAEAIKKWEQASQEDTRDRITHVVGPFTEAPELPEEEDNGELLGVINSCGKAIHAEGINYFCQLPENHPGFHQVVTPDNIILRWSEKE